MSQTIKLTQLHCRIDKHCFVIFKFASASGRLRPPVPLTRGFAPGPHLGHCPKTPLQPRAPRSPCFYNYTAYLKLYFLFTPVGEKSWLRYCCIDLVLFELNTCVTRLACITRSCPHCPGSPLELMRVCHTYYNKNSVSDHVQTSSHKQ